MKAVQFDRLGSPDVLRLAELPEPHAGPGQVRIAVRAAGVNPVDWKIRNGSTLRALPVPLPHVPGFEAAGVVDEIGDGVTGTAIGQEVFGAAPDATAEHAVLDRALDLGVRFTAGTEGRAFYALQDAADLFEQGRFSMPVAHVWPFTQLAEAHRVSESGHVRRKLVVVPDGAEGVPPAM